MLQNKAHSQEQPSVTSSNVSLLGVLDFDPHLISTEVCILLLQSLLISALSFHPSIVAQLGGASVCQPKGSFSKAPCRESLANTTAVEALHAHFFYRLSG